MAHAMHRAVMHIAQQRQKAVDSEPLKEERPYQHEQAPDGQVQQDPSLQQGQKHAAGAISDQTTGQTPDPTTPGEQQVHVSSHEGAQQLVNQADLEGLEVGTNWSVQVLHVIDSTPLDCLMAPQGLVTVLKACQLTDVQKFLGIRHTIGTIPALPPLLHACVASFQTPHRPDKSRLTVGCRALCKHCHRDTTSQFWGQPKGSEQVKNEYATAILKRLLHDVCWLNIHTLPHSVYVFEVRNSRGYGARWSADGKVFAKHKQHRHPHTIDHFFQGCAAYPSTFKVLMCI
eukprot:m.98814 g.98814  ORF g.98814 m.98814 type:complete len:287 (-) comp13127_c0_seq8:48-908(-)